MRSEYADGVRVMVGDDILLLVVTAAGVVKSQRSGCCPI